jgi:Ser/Thr protein kinase RdoA (MazF antagonist)
MDTILLESACTLFNTSPEELNPLSGGHYNAVYQFPYGDGSAILRIGVEDCPIHQTLGMLEWVRFLYLKGANVPAPVFSINNHLVERLSHYGTSYTLTAFEKVEGVLAENIPPSQWDDTLFHNIGQETGRMHKFSAGYHPSRPNLTRPQWFESYEVSEAEVKLAHTDDPAREQLTNLIAELQNLPASPPDFGLIHGDLHFANFLIQPGGRMAIIDFDDCVYGWFAMDIAMALFDVLVLYNASSEEGSQQFARRFLSSYLAGYRLENDLSPFWQMQITHFLKLKELCIYAALIDHPDKDRTGTWVGNFMFGRAERILDNIPYVAIDTNTIEPTL